MILPLKSGHFVRLLCQQVLCSMTGKVFASPALNRFRSDAEMVSWHFLLSAVHSLTSCVCTRPLTFTRSWAQLREELKVQKEKRSDETQKPSEAKRPLVSVLYFSRLQDLWTSSGCVCVCRDETRSYPDRWRKQVILQGERGLWETPPAFLALDSDGLKHTHTHERLVSAGRGLGRTVYVWSGAICLGPGVSDLRHAAGNPVWQDRTDRKCQS